jgi:hypothetical protein
VLIFWGITNLLSFAVKRKSVWEWCARTRVTADTSKASYRNSIAIIVILLCFTSILFIFVTIKYARYLSIEKKRFAQETNLLPAIMPFSTPAIPVSYFQTKKYRKDIERDKQKPFDYIMKLFENHDIVVLCEREHPEYTQWELFSQIILNDTFATKIGNVATEFGRVNEQVRLDSLMNTRFENEEAREKSFASLVRENGGMWVLWDNSNIYDFAVALSKFNEKQNPNTRINWFFTDNAGDWSSIKSIEDWEQNNFKNHKRDAIMAEHVIAIMDSLSTRTDRNKLLRIINTHHAYHEYREGDTTEADYLYEKYGDKIAFVWLNTTAHKDGHFEIFMLPYQNGIVDAAACNMGDSAWALSFENSILGNDHFELLPHRDKWHLKMKDLFDGMIYYQYPWQQCRKYGFPYLLTGFRDTLLKRSALVGDEYHARIQTLLPICEKRSQIQEIIPLYSFLIINIIYYFLLYFNLFWLLGCLIFMVINKIF